MLIAVYILQDEGSRWTVCAVLAIIRLLRLEIDRGSQPLYPIFDETLGMLYVAGKVGKLLFLLKSAVV